MVGAGGAIRRSLTVSRALVALVAPVGAGGAAGGAGGTPFGAGMEASALGGAAPGGMGTNGAGALGAPSPMTTPGAPNSGMASGAAPNAPSASSVPPIPGGSAAAPTSGAPNNGDAENTPPAVVVPGQKGPNGSCARADAPTIWGSIGPAASAIRGRRRGDFESARLHFLVRALSGPRVRAYDVSVQQKENEHDPSVVEARRCPRVALRFRRPRGRSYRRAVTRARTGAAIERARRRVFRFRPVCGGNGVVSFPERSRLSVHSDPVAGKSGRPNAPPARNKVIRWPGCQFHGGIENGK